MFEPEDDSDEKRGKILLAIGAIYALCFTLLVIACFISWFLNKAASVRVK